MSHSDVSLIVSTLCGLAPGILALLLAVSAYITSHGNSARIAGNTARLDHMENGGGDKKIDDRLAKIGLVDRRDADGLPTPAIQAPAPPEANSGALGTQGGTLPLATEAQRREGPRGERWEV